MHCVSGQASTLWWNIDFTTIVVAAAATSVVWVHFIFWCDEKTQIMFIFCMVAMTASTILTVLRTGASPPPPYTDP